MVDDLLQLTAARGMRLQVAAEVGRPARQAVIVFHVLKSCRWSLDVNSATTRGRENARGVSSGGGTTRVPRNLARGRCAAVPQSSSSQICGGDPIPTTGITVFRYRRLNIYALPHEACLPLVYVRLCRLSIWHRCALQVSGHVG